MEEVIIVITVKHYNTLEEFYSEYANSFNIPYAVYLALLTGGESAIKNYYISNAPLQEYERLISATMIIANTVERGQTVHAKWSLGVATYTIGSDGNIAVATTKLGHTTNRVICLSRKPKELVTIKYYYENHYRSRTETLEKNEVYALFEDATYSLII